MSAPGIVFLILTVALSASRTVLELLAVDPGTGFYTELPWLVIAQNLLFVIAAALLAFLILRSPRGCTMRFDRFSRPMGVLLAAAGILLGVSGVQGLLRGREGLSPASGLGVAVVSGVARALSLAAAVALVFLALSLLRSGGYRSGLWSSAAVALWLTVDVVARFMDSPTIASISDQTLEVTALCMGALFWLQHARFTCKEKLETAPRYAKLWALLLALFAVPLCAGQLACRMSGRHVAVHMDLPRLLALLALGLYAALWSEAMRFHSQASRNFS